MILMWNHKLYLIDWTGRWFDFIWHHKMHFLVYNPMFHLEITPICYHTNNIGQVRQVNQQFQNLLLGFAEASWTIEIANTTIIRMVVNIILLVSRTTPTNYCSLRKKNINVFMNYSLKRKQWLKHQINIQWSPQENH